MWMRFTQHIIMLHVAAAMGLSVQAQQGAPSARGTKNNVIQTVRKYADAIGCFDRIDEDNVVAMVPWNGSMDQYDALYAVVWHGDIGCAGGSGTWGTYLAFVVVRNGRFLVDVDLSEPCAQIETEMRAIKRIVKATATTITLDGVDYGPDDPNCCPTAAVRTTLVRAQDGASWEAVKQRR